MPLRIKLLFVLLSLFSSANSQERQKAVFGKPTESELAMKFYEKDTTANAVVLYEQGYYYYAAVGDYIKLIKEVHRKIKIFDSQTRDYGTVEIPLFSSDGTREKVKGFSAWTYNGNTKRKVSSDAIFITSEPEIGSVCKIVFPNVTDGSVIEYVYKLESPFLFNFYGWHFQDELPKIYSEFLFKIPLEYQFENILYGNQSLYLNKSEVTDDCLQTKVNTMIVGCPITLYAMKDIPAFQQEDYMLSSKNYISRVEFEPRELFTSTGWRRSRKFTKEWKDVDKFIKKGEMGSQLKNSKYFKENLADSILAIADDLQRAKAIYTYIQNHYTWDGTFYSSETEVKDAFDDKKGSVPEINLSLINALEAAGLDAKLMLLSTRQNGLPTTLYPVMTKFNYTVAALKIADQTYLLDATDKQAPFGLIPFRTLNVQGRVMDFKKGSYWMPIEPFKQNIHYVNAQIIATDDGNFKGKVSQANYGYIGLKKRSTIEEKTLEAYIKTEGNDKAGVEIQEYQVEDLNSIEKPLKENYNVTIEPEMVGDKVFLYPFFNKTYISENPFKLNERNYPIDFGFPFTNTYLLSIDLGNVYETIQLPESRTIKLPGDDGECSVTYISEGNKINIRFNMKLNEYRFPPAAYQSLKEYFGTMITILKEESIVLKKI
ncbi:transglutaminase domain-containing protein [Aequorivita marisscotiae]|uniref:DUF3857 domain-containing protein n=1 Tax=Aequorivita marisscotiae TaxID=3040348 RepID=A0ABY8KSY8_9FLAO|nr:DUF3857 domain-containing protein [Aequorivita sp. Ant34-E75]WGF91270.1 hypothetical protein QCQ61_08565 [Aequorivita sp. Ant34-E75]